MENNNNNEMFPDMTDQFAPDDIEANKSVAAIATIPCLFWIPLVADNSKNSAFAKFYANQGLILLIAGFALGIVNGVVQALLRGNVPILPGLISLICSLAPTAAWIYELVAALNGKAKPIPFIGTLFTILK